MDLRGIKEFLKDTIKYILVAIIVLVVYLYVVSFQQIIGPSMEPNYYEGQIFILNKLKYEIFNPKRFEVIVINSKKSKFMIKRVIGLPGEHIEYKDDTLYVNGEVIVENFSKNGNTDDFEIVENLNEQRIPKNHYFVVGDNRINSEDSRIFGFVSKDEIVGKVGFRIWPLFEKR